MWIDSNKLQKFIEKSTLNASITETVINVTDNVIYSTIRTADNVGATVTHLKNVKGLTPMILPIKDTGMLLKSLKLFTGQVEMECNNNVLSIYDKTRQVDIVLAEESFITNVLPNEFVEKIKAKCTKETFIRLPKKPFDDIVKDMSVVKSSTIKIVMDNKAVQFITGETSFDSIKETFYLSAVDITEATSQFGQTLVDVISVMHDSVEVAMQNENTIAIRETTQDFDVTYIVAPIIDNPEEE